MLECDHLSFPNEYSDTFRERGDNKIGSETTTAAVASADKVRIGLRVLMSLTKFGVHHTLSKRGGSMLDVRKYVVR